MKIDIITLFPEMFKGPFEESILRRAQDKGLVEINLHNLRKWTTDKRGTVDDRPYGGGTGMIMMVEPLVKAIEELKSSNTKVILLSAKGRLWKQAKAFGYSKEKHLILIAGHYEGIDERVVNFVDEEISIGDYVLTGGEIPAMVLVDSIVRLIPGVLEKEEATRFESFSPYTLNAKRYPLLEYPQYTRPEEFRGLKVPKILLSGNHAKIAAWKREQALKTTRKNRPDLLKCQKKC
ncbi:MAG TPA: tRNA (guanosine(37)-N1)-methyltransferase TrmD [Clostridia bacterium]|nr:tRNA (guanosine(37)-N1)-methyltransferase TrmD [Clostridia bacterium]